MWNDEVSPLLYTTIVVIVYVFVKEIFVCFILFFPQSYSIDDETIFLDGLYNQPRSCEPSTLGKEREIRIIQRG